MLNWLDNLLSTDRRPRPLADSPIVLGATGGSGTRAFHGVLETAGVHMGERLNEAGDAMDFEPFLDACINPILHEVGHLDYELEQLSPALREDVLGQFEVALQLFSQERPEDALWGWKNPRTMYVLPIIQHFCPGFRFLHIVRDGRYMAFSHNRNQLNKHYEALFGEAPQAPLEVAAARLWSQANCEVARWGWGHLGRRYILIRFEDLCRKPTPMVSKLIKALELSGADAAMMADCVRGESDLGRWNDADKALRNEIALATKDGLGRFGYR